jgi:hypothetical protein
MIAAEPDTCRSHAENSLVDIGQNRELIQLRACRTLR